MGFEFFNKLKSKNTGPESVDISTLHPDFRIEGEYPWYFNREYNLFKDRGSNLKIRFGFDDPAVLNGITFHTKIGPNLDAEIPHKYIGFSYAKNNQRQALEESAKQFPWAELIVGLDNQGVSDEKSERIPLNH